jgi:hypothetical protein
MAVETPAYTLEQLTPVRRLVAKSGTSLAAIVKVASGIVKPIAQRISSRVTTVPASIHLTENEAYALAALPTKMDVEWPTSRRLLTAEEKLELLELLKATKMVKGIVARTEESLKAAFFNHLDIMAEAAEQSVIDDTTEIHKQGWYCLPGRVEHPDVDVVATREIRAGTANLTEEALAGLETDGLITHDTYLAWTRQVREVNELAILASIAANPWQSLLIAQATERGAASPALQIRKAK